PTSRPAPSNMAGVEPESTSILDSVSKDRRIASSLCYTYSYRIPQNRPTVTYRIPLTVSSPLNFPQHRSSIGISNQYLFSSKFPQRRPRAVQRRVEDGVDQRLLRPTSSSARSSWSLRQG
ncbi:hypothetical protein PFISCL1PPCAC_22623, partial [Pristionchus fissidentatus]